MAKDAEAIARAYWVTGPGAGDIRDETLPPPSSGDVVVRALYSGISRGTEALVFRGQVPPAEYQRMRAPFQSGDFPGPVKYGYASVGVVEAGPSRLLGREAFVLFPHQTRYVVPQTAVHPLPSGVPASRAVLGANMETALNGLWDAQVTPGQRVAVIGGGAVGCLVAWVARQVGGCDVELVDVNPAREPVVRALGVRFAQPANASRGLGTVIHTSGSAAGLDLALAVAGFEATIVEMSWYGAAPVAVRLGEAFHSQRLTIKSSQVGAVAPAARARYDPAARLELALSLLTDPALDVLVTGESAFEDLPGVMARLAESPAGALCHRIRYA